MLILSRNSLPSSLPPPLLHPPCGSSRQTESQEEAEADPRAEKGEEHECRC